MSNDISSAILDKRLPHRLSVFCSVRWTFELSCLYIDSSGCRNYTLPPTDTTPKPVLFLSSTNSSFFRLQTASMCLGLRFTCPSETSQSMDVRWVEFFQKLISWDEATLKILENNDKIKEVPRLKLSRSMHSNIREIPINFCPRQWQNATNVVAEMRSSVLCSCIS